MKYILRAVHRNCVPALTDRNGTHETLIDVSLITVRSMAFTKIVSILPSDGVNVSFRLMNFKSYA